MAARRDMGNPDTSVEPSILVGMRIKDVYDPSKDALFALIAPWPELEQRFSWRRPWVGVDNTQSNER